MHFSTEKKQVELKILIMAHRCQICNKKILLKKIPQLEGGGGVWAIEETSSIFYKNLTSKSLEAG